VGGGRSGFLTTQLVATRSNPERRRRRVRDTLNTMAYYDSPPQGSDLQVLSRLLQLCADGPPPGT